MANARNPAKRDHRARFYPIDARAGAEMKSSMAAALSSFSEHVSGKILRSVAHAGAEVLYNELKLRTPITKTGNLNAAIYQYFDKRRGTDHRSIYWVGVNKAKAPHWHNVEYGHMRVNVLIPIRPGMVVKPGVKVVQGRDGRSYIATRERLPAPIQVPARPYLRPTWDAKAQEAVNAMTRRFYEKVREYSSAGPQPV